jgi:hypothetical protein
MNNPRHRQNSRRASQKGIALVFVTFAIAALLVAITGALVTGSANSQATSNYKGASQVHYAAESGLSEAIQRINQTGIVNFQNDVYDDWANRWGTTWHTAPLSGFQYTVTPVVNGTNPSQRGRLLAQATGPNNLSNYVVAEVVRTNNLSTAPGAVYLATDDNVSPNFNGNSFHIDGNDHSYQGGAGPGAPVPGLSTRNQPNTGEVVDELSLGGGNQLDNIVGLGYQNTSPPVPSVMTSAWAPSISQMNDFVDDILAQPHVTSSDTTITGNMSLGTISPPAPQITYSTGSVTVKGAGTVDGSGVWIVDGDLEIQGTLNFAGLIIVRGKTLVNKDPGASITGNATVYGSLWSQDVNFQAGGSSTVNYSTDALALASLVAGGNPLPTTIRVLSMADCAVLPAGANGCPS